MHRVSDLRFNEAPAERGGEQLKAPNGAGEVVPLQ